MQVVLNRRNKEQLVIKLHNDGNTLRQIASIVHMSFSNIGSIIRKIEGQDEEVKTKDIKNKSKDTQALFLFSSGKKPIDVAIELDISANEIEDIMQEYWVLNQLDELALVYLEVKNCLTLFLRLFHTMKKNKLINQKDIQTILRYTAHDLPSLENKIYQLTNDVINLEDKKRDLIQKLVLWNAQLSDLGRAIDIKNQQLKRLGNLN
jgi:hypothetical protein